MTVYGKITLVLCAVCAAVTAAALDLNGSWQLDYWPQPDDGAVRSVPLPTGLSVKSIEATVPGNCELDLVRAGILPPPELGLNAMRLRPYEGYQWLYTRTFDAPVVEKGGHAVLVFDGIDTLADIFLNGEKLAETANMLVEHSFDVTKSLRKGANVLQVLLRPPAVETQFKSLSELGYCIGGVDIGDAEPYRKAGHAGGWDISPRVFSAGLWRDVRIEVRPPIRIDEVVWFTTDIDVEKGAATLSGRCRVQAPFRYMDKCRLKCCVRREGRTYAEYSYPFHGYHPRLEARRIKGIECWWPRGMGQSSLYDVVLGLEDDDGSVLAENVTRIGFRTVELVRRDWYSPEDPGEFLFRVNGEPCYVRGSNWVPLDAFHSRDRDRMTETLEMFRELNCNMVRVWGGGVYEPETFFDWCDKNGLMVWQDLMTACSVFPQSDEYASETYKEIVKVVKRVRNHPSLVLWSGNNENDYAYGWGTPFGPVRNPNDDRISRKVIPSVLFEYDVSRPYLPCSPYHSSDVWAGKARLSEEHLWGERGYYKTPFYTNSICHLASEMGYHGCPNRASIERMMTKDCIYPWKEIVGNDPQGDYHWNDEWLFKAANPFLDREAAGFMGRNSLMTKQVKILFGHVPSDLDDFIRASQIVQSEAMKTFVENFRMRKFAGKNGLVWWNMRDCWPLISDAVVDYYGGKKLAYYSIGNSQRDVVVCLDDDHRSWAVNDTRQTVQGSVKFRDFVSGKTLFECGDFTIPPNGRILVGNIPFSGRGMILIDATLRGAAYRNHFLYGDPPFDFKTTSEWIRQAMGR